MLPSRSDVCREGGSTDIIRAEPAEGAYPNSRVSRTLSSRTGGGTVLARLSLRRDAGNVPKGGSR